MLSLEDRRHLTALALANLPPSTGSRRRLMVARLMTTYGQKDGEGPNTGKKAATYQFTYPDGTVAKKRSFKVDQETAYALVYEFRGKWYVSAIRSAPVEAERQSTVLATRI